MIFAFFGSLGPPYFNIGATSLISREVLCRPYVGFKNWGLANYKHFCDFDLEILNY